MPYHFNTPEDQRAMLRAIGVESIEELFECIPEELQLGRSLDFGPALSELELTQHMSALADQNLHSHNSVCFLGGGSYDHFIPAVVDAIASRGEFYTSYTPYQPEVSQGNLQAMFEYQTLICQLTGMDVSNASLYDGGSAMTEAALLSLSVVRGRSKVVVAETVHPEFRQILETYLHNLEAELITVPCPTGVSDLESFAAVIDDQTACVIVQQPNFFGCVEDLSSLTKLAHDHDAAMVVSVDPISLGVLKRPGDYGVDIVVAEGQSLGNPMSFGGPYLGHHGLPRPSFLFGECPVALRDRLRIIMAKTCWVLTMQTREQHIRRDKATSNICTNQGLFALTSQHLLVVAGPAGLAGGRHALHAESTLLGGIDLSIGTISSCRMTNPSSRNL